MQGEGQQRRGCYAGRVCSGRGMGYYAECACRGKGMGYYAECACRGPALCHVMSCHVMCVQGAGLVAQVVGAEAPQKLHASRGRSRTMHRAMHRAMHTVMHTDMHTGKGERTPCHIHVPLPAPVLHPWRMPPPPCSVSAAHPAPVSLRSALPHISMAAPAKAARAGSCEGYLATS